MDPAIIIAILGSGTIGSACGYLLKRRIENSKHSETLNQLIQVSQIDQHLSESNKEINHLLKLNNAIQNPSAATESSTSATTHITLTREQLEELYRILCDSLFATTMLSELIQALDKRPSLKPKDKDAHDSTRQTTDILTYRIFQVLKAVNYPMTHYAVAIDRANRVKLTPEDKKTFADDQLSNLPKSTTSPRLDD
jgi:uncharacterized protein YerC